MNNKKRIYITEEQFKKLLTEDVFIASKNNSTKKAQLKYNKNQSYNRGNLKSQDKLKTDKMDELDEKTYQVPLKGGLMSYNITSINGTEVMHYFKRIFDKQQTVVNLENDETKSEEEYELEMQDSEFNNFMTQFKNKVSAVVKFQSAQFMKENLDIDFNQIAIYPVPSNSKFNIEMAKRLQYLRIFNLSPKIIDSSLLHKNVDNLELDSEFIENNKEYYNSSLNQSQPQATHLDNVITSKNKLQAYRELQDRVNEINKRVKKLLIKWNNRPVDGNFSDSYLNGLYKLYNEFTDYLPYLKEQDIYYQDVVNNKQTKYSFGNSISQLKYSKGPSVEKRSNLIYNVLLTNGFLKKHRGKNIIPLIVYYELKPFEIKKLSNDVRMGLRNYFQIDNDQEKIKQETEKSNETIVVVFDDNISGGATLSDICLRLKELGFNYVIPITFGKMYTQWNLGLKPISKPNGGKFNYSKQSTNVVNDNNTENALNILWLDDERNPNKYFNKKSASDAFLRNVEYYKNNIFNKGKVNFIWVKNFDEFTEYISDNGVPQFVSFDRDLKKGNNIEREADYPSGEDCAQWLVDYCHYTKQNLPNYFVHSANKNGQINISSILQKF